MSESKKSSDFFKDTLHRHEPAGTNPFVKKYNEATRQGAARALNVLCLSPGRGRADWPRRKENVARLDRHLTGCLFENEPSGRIDRLKRALDRLRGPRHADPCAKTSREREPFGAY
jgi:hypothetical protein